ncbi:MAG: D-alanyl-D-alanine carboxypeptidase, partial [Clostridia bacterium]|nr:D-alanyl-D-alanine carboxypeptidase [Clostridia bacterium]
MKKTIFSIIFTIIIILSSIFVPFTVGAYEVTEFEVTADAGALISLDTGEFLYEKNLDKKIYPAAITNIMT